MDLSNLDGFFLTAPLATPDLKAKVEEAKDQLFDLQFEYSAAQNEYTIIQAELQKMEEKSTFIMTEMGKAMSIFTPPPDGEPGQAYDLLEKYLYDPLEWTEASIGAAGGAMWVFAATGPRIARLMSKVRGFSKLGAVAKSTKWTKLMKLGKASVALSAALFIVEYAVQLHTAGQINAYFRKQSKELKAQIAKAKSEIAELRALIAEGTKARNEILAESGFTSIGQFTRGMNEAITALGRQTAYLGTARKMLMDGLTPEMVGDFVPDLPADAIEILHRKLAAERLLVQGETAEAVAAASEFTLVQVGGLQKLRAARMGLLEGGDAAELAKELGLTAEMVEGEEEALRTDVRKSWALLARDQDTGSIARKTLFTVTTIASFEQELDAKRRLIAGEATEDVVAAVSAGADAVAQWQSELAEAIESAKSLVNQPGPPPRTIDIAADLQLPHETVLALREAA